MKNYNAKFKITLFLLFLLCITLSVSGCSIQEWLTGVKQPTQRDLKILRSDSPQTEPIALQIDFGDDKIITNYELLITNYENQYLWPAMKRVLEENNIYFDYQDYGGELGVFIKQIGDKKNGEDGKYWQYLVNGEYAKIGVSNYKVQAGDVILWKFASNYEL